MPQIKKERKVLLGDVVKNWCFSKCHLLGSARFEINNLKHYTLF